MKSHFLYLRTFINKNVFIVIKTLLPLNNMPKFSIFRHFYLDIHCDFLNLLPLYCQYILMYWKIKFLITKFYTLFLTIQLILIKVDSKVLTVKRQNVLWSHNKYSQYSYNYIMSYQSHISLYDVIIKHWQLFQSKPQFFRCNLEVLHCLKISEKINAY